MYISEVYTILLSRDLKKQKVGHHSAPTIHHTPPTTQIKKKASGAKSEILIKYERIKWTPSRKASHLLSGG